MFQLSYNHPISHCVLFFGPVESSGLKIKIHRAMYNFFLQNIHPDNAVLATQPKLFAQSPKNVKKIEKVQGFLL